MDTAAREKEIEERLLKERERAKEKKEVGSKGKERKVGVMSDVQIGYSLSRGNKSERKQKKSSPYLVPRNLLTRPAGRERLRSVFGRKNKCCGRRNSKRRVEGRR